MTSYKNKNFIQNMQLDLVRFNLIEAIFGFTNKFYNLLRNHFMIEFGSFILTTFFVIPTLRSSNSQKFQAFYLSCLQSVWLFFKSLCDNFSYKSIHKLNSETSNLFQVSMNSWSQRKSQIYCLNTIILVDVYSFLYFNIQQGGYLVIKTCQYFVTLLMEMFHCLVPWQTKMMEGVNIDNDEIETKIKSKNKPKIDTA